MILSRHTEDQTVIFDCSIDGGMRRQRCVRCTVQNGIAKNVIVSVVAIN